MNLENFDQKSTILINAAFSYASENNYAYLTPLNILEIMIKTNEDVKSTLCHFSVDLDNLYQEAQKHTKKTKKKTENEETLIQGNIVMLIEQAQNEAKNLGSKKVNCNIILLTLTSDISPQSKLLLESHGVTFEKLFDFLNSKKVTKNLELEFTEKYTVDITSLALNNKIDPIIGREEEIKRTI